MHTPSGPLGVRLTQFRSSESGGITVESVLWLPIYLLFFALIADVSMMFHGQTKAMRIVQDANRLASFQYYTTADEVEANVKSRIVNISDNATVATTLGTDSVATVVSFPVNDVAIIGFVGKLIAVVVPNLNVFNVQSAVDAGNPIPLIYLAGAFNYLLCFAIAVWMLAMLLFEDRDLA